MTKDIPNESTFCDCAFAGCKGKKMNLAIWVFKVQSGCYQSNQLSDRWDGHHRDKYGTFNAIIVSPHFRFKCGRLYVGYMCRLYGGVKRNTFCSVGRKNPT
jgi:hypothetical protein